MQPHLVSPSSSVRSFASFPFPQDESKNRRRRRRGWEHKSTAHNQIYLTYTKYIACVKGEKRRDFCTTIYFFSFVALPCILLRVESAVGSVLHSTTIQREGDEQTNKQALNLMTNVFLSMMLLYFFFLLLLLSFFSSLPLSFLCCKRPNLEPQLKLATNESQAKKSRSTLPPLLLPTFGQTRKTALPNIEFNKCT